MCTMKWKKIVLNILLVLVLILLLLCDAVTTLLERFDDMYNLLWGGALSFIFPFIYSLSFILPVVFKEKISKRVSLQTMLIVSSLISIIMAVSVYVGARCYISSFTREKWDKYRELRFYMIESLEKKNQILGKSKEEIEKIIGKCDYVYEKYADIQGYYVGDNIIDLIVYNIEFENGVAVSTDVVEY